MAKFITLEGLGEFKSKLPDYVAGQGFIKNTVSNLTNYYTKTQIDTNIYTKDDVDDLISNLSSGAFSVVASLPTTGEANIIYLVPKTDPETQNVKDEYIWVNNAWEKIGDTSLDLSEYSTTEEMEAAIELATSGLLTTENVSTIVEAYGYATETFVTTGFVAKETGKGLSTNDYTTTEKNKLAGIAEGAEVNLVNDVKVDGTSVLSSKIAVLQTATNTEIDNLFN